MSRKIQPLVGDMIIPHCCGSFTSYFNAEYKVVNGLLRFWCPLLFSNNCSSGIGAAACDLLTNFSQKFHAVVPGILPSIRHVQYLHYYNHCTMSCRSIVSLKRNRGPISHYKNISEEQHRYNRGHQGLNCHGRSEGLYHRGSQTFLSHRPLALFFGFG
ncbi:hypothetical protein TNCV_2143251 [Trichonephila clavipes]|nr:hypothetical protein TNCV_2143251 [Trichonephila clavipes]